MAAGFIGRSLGRARFAMPCRHLRKSAKDADAPHCAAPSTIKLRRCLQRALQSQDNRAAGDGVVHNDQGPRGEFLEKHGDNLRLGDRSGPACAAPERKRRGLDLRLLFAFHPYPLQPTRAPQYEDPLPLVHGQAVRKYTTSAFGWRMAPSQSRVSLCALCGLSLRPLRFKVFALKGL